MSKVIHIPLTKGKVALVDECDAWIAEFNWSAALRKTVWYAIRTARIDGRKRAIYMHRFILGDIGRLEVDHINHDGLDNRRANLRVATRRQNCCNIRKQEGSTSKFRGVYFRADTGKWAAQTKHFGKRYNIGCFATESEAAEAYRQCVARLQGEFACLQ